MKVAVVTTFSPKGYEVYGRRMVETFVANWPKDVWLHVFYEGEKPADADERAIWHSLDADQDRAKFLEVHKDPPMGPNEWDYRQNIATYSHKVFAMTGAPRDCDYLLWLDADSETIAKVQEEFLPKIVSDRHVATYLGRPWWRHSETGYIAFNMKAHGSEFLDDLRMLYTGGIIATLKEKHDCWAFDHVRVKWERNGFRFHNLCADAHGIDVFSQTPLGLIMKHNKGPNEKMRAYGNAMLPGAA